jgi:hypothetical protein
LPSPGADLDLRVLRVTGPAEEVPARAVAAIAALPGFRFAEAGPDGVVRGYTDACRFAVVIVPGVPKTAVYVVAAGQGIGNKSVNRSGEAVDRHLTKSHPGPKPTPRAGTPDPAADARHPALAVRIGLRPHLEDRRRLRPLTELTLTQLGCEKAMAVPFDGGVWAQGMKKDGTFTVLLIDPNGSPTTTHYLSVATARDAYRAAREAGDAANLLLAALYD